MVAIQQKRARNLSKEEELELGSVIQASNKALEQIEKLRSKANLSVEDELRIQSLEMQIVQGEKAVEQLVRSNINLVVKIAAGYRERYPFAPELDDCVQEGFAGLLIAARKYDPNHAKGRNKFSTMAYPWIGQAISRGVNSSGKLVRLPENRVTDYGRIIRVEREALEQNSELTQEELNQEVQEVTGLSREYIHAIKNASAGHYSLNRPIGEDDSGAELMDVISEINTEDSAEEEMLSEYTITQIKNALEPLSEVQRDTVLSFFGMYIEGINDQETLDPKVVRKKHTMTQAVYKRTLEETLPVIREYMNEQGLTLSDFM